MRRKQKEQTGKAGVRMVALLAALALVLGFGSYSRPAMAAQKEFEIGGIFGLSGPGSEALARKYDGVKAAVAWINDKGGLNIKGDKYRIKMIAEDSKGSVDGMIAAANKLIFDNRVKLMIGGISVPPFKIAISKLTEDNKVLSMNLDGLGVVAEMTPKIPYTFETIFSRASYIVGWEQFVKFYPKAKRAAIIAPEDPSTVEDAQHNGDAAKLQGLTIVAEEHYPFGTADFYPLWTKLLAAKPDVIAASAGFAEWMGNVVKQGRELGFKGPFCFNMMGADSHVIVKMAGDYATDIFAVNFDWSSPKMPDMVKTIGQIIKQKIGKEMTTDSWMGFEGVWFLTQAIENAQSIDPTVVKNAFEKMTKIEASTGPGKLGGAKTYGIAHMVSEPLPILRIMDGKIEHIRFVEPILP